MVGGINADTLARVAGAHTHPGTSNPGDTRHTAGGVGRNIAENLARLGTTVRMIGVVGTDLEGDQLIGGLADLGVDTSGVRRSKEHPTGSYTAILDDRGELVIGVADMAATESLTPEQIEPTAFADAAWLVLDGNLPAATLAHCRALALEAADTDLSVVLDPVGVTKAARLGELTGVHTFTPTAEELTSWAGVEDTEAAIARAHAQGVAVVWLREGERGSTLRSADGRRTRLSFPPAEVVDVTGAGDAMLAAYVHRLLRGDTIEAAGRFATVAARLTVTSADSVRPDLTEELVTATLKELSTP